MSLISVMDIFCLKSRDDWKKMDSNVLAACCSSIETPIHQRESPPFLPHLHFRVGEQPTLQLLLYVSPVLPASTLTSSLTLLFFIPTVNLSPRYPTSPTGIPHLFSILNSDKAE
ncbi:hypothetical protein KC19_8G050900 [Ceratodon purpureus]|uniref:Uncharacterized protein n=1 Tax=Ceratodon purpureus TaxID=3225 RepID=A0A8T0H3L2_CERPU|nr:hypothetical protein KC19_8G050900 [Ceratodon purpureus]